MARKKPLSQQVVVIAGGSYGLGRAIARAAADRGAKVVVGARTREALDDAVRATSCVASSTSISRDLVLLRNGWKAQHTDELKPQDSPDNLFEPMPGDPPRRARPLRQPGARIHRVDVAAPCTASRSAQERSWLPWGY